MSLRIDAANVDTRKTKRKKNEEMALHGIGSWKTDNGQQTTDYGQQTTDNGLRTSLCDGRRFWDNRQRTTDNGQQTMDNWELCC